MTYIYVIIFLQLTFTVFLLNILGREGGWAEHSAIVFYMDIKAIKNRCIFGYGLSYYSFKV